LVDAYADDFGLEVVGERYEDWLDAPVEDVAYGVVEQEAAWMWDFTVGEEPETERLIVARGIPLGEPDGETAGVIADAAHEPRKPMARIRAAAEGKALDPLLSTIESGATGEGEEVSPAISASLPSSSHRILPRRSSTSTGRATSTRTRTRGRCTTE